MKTYSQSDIDKELAAVRKAADLRAETEKKAETLRRKQISDIGRAYGCIGEANEAIRDDLSVEAFRNDSVIRSLESERDALASAINSGTRTPARGALLSDPSDIRTNQLLDRYNEAKKRNTTE